MKTSALLFAAALVCAPFTMTQAQESTNMFVLSDDHSSASLTAEASIISGDNPISVTYFKGSNADPQEETKSYAGANIIGSYGNLVPTEEVPNYYIFDFSKSIAFGNVDINWEGNTRPAEYHLYVSNDKEIWTQVGKYSTSDKEQIWDNWTSNDISAPILGRYFKITITAPTNKEYVTRLDGIRVRELPLPTSVSLNSVISGFNDPWLSNHLLMGVGESATITASVLDQNGAIMTDLVPMISTTAAESEWNNGIYTPETAGKAIFTASYREFTSTLQVTTIDYENYIPSDK